MLSFRLELQLALSRLAAFASSTTDLCEAVSKSKPDLEVVVVGSGCSLGVSELAAQKVRECSSRHARAVTPLAFVSERSRPATVIFVSSEGAHRHILEAALHLHRESVAIIVTNRDQSPLTELLCSREAGARVLTPNVIPVAGGYIPVEKSIALLGIIFGLELVAAYEDASVRASQVAARLKELGNAAAVASTAFILHAGVEIAAAKDLETRLLEGGLLFPNAMDVWNFAHGRFNITTLKQPMMVIGLSTSRTQALVDHTIDILGTSLPVIRLHGGGVGASAWLSCYLQSLELLAGLAEIKGIDPAAPLSPVWGRQLYEEGIRHADTP